MMERALSEQFSQALVCYETAMQLVAVMESYPSFSYDGIDSVADRLRACGRMLVKKGLAHGAVPRSPPVKKNVLDVKVDATVIDYSVRQDLIVYVEEGSAVV
jgi:hypothetical protein